MSKRSYVPYGLGCIDWLAILFVTTIGTLLVVAVLTYIAGFWSF